VRGRDPLSLARTGLQEPLDKLGETLVLPPFLEAQRARIEAGLKPL